MTRWDKRDDNAQVKSFFSRLKAERLAEGYRVATLAEAETECFGFIEGHYKTVRRHSSLGYLSPLYVEKQLCG